MTPAGTEPATFRFVAQHLNHCATEIPSLRVCSNLKHPEVGQDVWTKHVWAFNSKYEYKNIPQLVSSEVYVHQTVTQKLCIKCFLLMT